ncbi:MAG: tyrosine-type recombinase/integrase [Microvirga sp.]|nr:integrase arm-type DNA-binding domain-containing protein [Beijerinckiaceae bacterium]
MARQVNRLSARTAATLSKPGRHSDGNGLYLVVDPSGAKRWLFLFRWDGKLKEMGLGGLSTTPLIHARERALEARRVLAGGRNPIDARRAAEAARQSAATFGAFADELVKDLSHGFRNEKHKGQWVTTLATHAAALRDRPLDQISTNDVLGVLAPIWQTKHETAVRLRGRIERVLDAAKAKGLRTGENPARWRGHLDKLLSKRRKLARGHLAALPYPGVPEFVAKLRERQAVAALALEFCIITASRSGEVFDARWDEIDRKAKVWTVPPERMKGGREHRVPLSERALEILDQVETIRTSDYVFPGKLRAAPLSSATMHQVLRRMKIEDATVHGFRSSFRDWAGECTSFPREIAEAALAHVVGDKTERAYRRGDALEKRRKLMEAWSGFLSATRAAGTVVPLRREAVG